MSVFISIDLAYANAFNNHSLCHMVRISSPPLKVLSMDTFDIVASTDCEKQIGNRLKSIRASPLYATATLVVDIEAGTGMEAYYMQRFIQRMYKNVVLLSDYSTPGTRGMISTKFSTLVMEEEASKVREEGEVEEKVIQQIKRALWLRRKYVELEVEQVTQKLKNIL